MSAPCPRPECGGEVHTDGWGTPIRCPRERTESPEDVVRRLRPDLNPEAGAGQARSFNALLNLVSVVHECDALRREGVRNAAGVIAERRGVPVSTVRGWLHRAKWRGLEPAAPPTAATRLTRAEAAIERVRQLHRPVEFRDRGTICAECSAFDGSSTDNSPVGYAHCATLKALEGEVS